MPRYTKREFQVGDYWLSRQARSPAWCRTWYDAKTNQTRRVSLRTTDFGEAKERLTDWFVLEHQHKKQPTNEVTIATIFARYFEKSASQLKSAGSVKRNLGLWLEYFTDATLAEAADVTRQEGFREWLIKDQGLSLSTVRKIVGMGKTACSWAYKRGEIEQVPYFELVKVPTPEPKGRHLEVDEVVQLLRAADRDYLRWFVLLLIGTAARPQAIYDLTFDQIDFERNLIDLNPAGRTQTQKKRPTVKLPTRLKPLLQVHQQAGISNHPVHFEGQPIGTIKASWGRARKKAGLDTKVVPYSIRRTMARFMRMEGVPAWEVQGQLGHDGIKVTELYTSHSPDYLTNAAKAIDHFFDQITCEYRVKELAEVLALQY